MQMDKNQACPKLSKLIKYWWPVFKQSVCWYVVVGVESEERNFDVGRKATKRITSKASTIVKASTQQLQ